MPMLAVQAQPALPESPSGKPHIVLPPTPTFHAVLVGHPLRKAVHVLPDALVLGVEQVHAVLGDTEAVLVDKVVAVAADVVALVDHERGKAQLPRRTLSNHPACRVAASASVRVWHQKGVGVWGEYSGISHSACDLPWRLLAGDQHIV